VAASLKAGMLGLTFALVVLLPSVAAADPLYLPGLAPVCGDCTFGTHLPQSAATGSVPGAGGGGIDPINGTLLNGVRTYIWDQAGFVNDGVVARGDADFAMMVWDLGVGVALDTVRLYTHQDHYSGGAITDNFIGQDVMEYSVWGSNDNVTYTMLSDVVGFDLSGGGAGLPTYTFAGTAPSIVYRGGSEEIGILNAYTRDYTFDTAYRYYGIRTSSVSLDYCDGTASAPGTPNFSCIDADPEIDAVAFHAGPITTAVPEPGSLVLLGTGMAFVARRIRRRVAGRQRS
jgi:hypothetical protein